MPDNRGRIVLLPGSRWSDIAGTDRQLAEALAEYHDVLWVDPPYPLLTARGGGPRPRGLHQVAPGILRLQPWTLPASSRPPVRWLTAFLLDHQLQRALSVAGMAPMATIALSPRVRLPRSSGTFRVLFVTDDWVAGAPLMGLDRGWLIRNLRSNLERSDRVVAITDELARELIDLGASAVEVIPNGTTLHRVGDGVRERLAGLIGQLNERLDVEILEQVAARGVALLVVGPLAARDGEVARRLDAFLALPNVTWVGAVPHTDLPVHLGRMSVGLTPYLDSDFNRSSFPLKTLEYLGAGIPVVSTDLPAARALDCPDIYVAKSQADFVAAVERMSDSVLDTDGQARRRQFGQLHSWDARARQLLDLLPAES